MITPRVLPFVPGDGDGVAVRFWASVRTNPGRNLGIIAMLLVSLLSGQAEAGEPADLCRASARIAAAEAAVPEEVLLAITLVETGRTIEGRLQPWPWTVNADGEGHWFPDRESAVLFAEALDANGQTSFDVGCFQINHRWHGDGFGSVEAMFDPVENARYAARFLAELAQDRDNWSSAAGAYHSRTPAFAERYRMRFDTILADLAGGMPLGSPSPGPVAPAEANLPGYEHPLLQARDAPRTPGSLVPLAQVPAT
jgi:hypothetical protein